MKSTDEDRPSSRGSGPSSDSEAAEPLVPPSGSVFNLASTSSSSIRPVTDADEEIFELYSLSTPSEHSGGLGYVDGRSDEVGLTVELGVEFCPVRMGDGEASKRGEGKASRVRGKAKAEAKGSRAGQLGVPGSSLTRSTKSRPILDVTVRQNVTALRSRQGDTGSVIWRASLELSSLFLDALEGHRHLDADGELLEPLFDVAALRQARVLELGAGTGVLASVVLSHPSFKTASTKSKLAGPTWLATDQAHLVPLLRLNLESRQGASVAELDWLHCSRVLDEAKKSASTSARQRLARLRQEILGPLSPSTLSEMGANHQVDEGDEAQLPYPDLIIAADCIYNPSLFPALLNTLEVCTPSPLSGGRQTTVLIVCELRASDMLRDFLDALLGRRIWSVVGLEQKRLGPGLEKGSAAWIAWRKEA